MDSRFKFRVWDKYSKSMLTPRWFEFEKNGNIMFQHDKSTIFFRQVETQYLMQCIGRKDINKNLIFEGDISSQGDVIEFCEAIEGTPGFYWKELRTGYHHHIEYLTTPIEIVGNIHENPDLLEQK